MKQPPTRTLYCQGVNRRSAALRRGDWKLVVRRDNGGTKRELYNLSEDPAESANLADEHPRILADLHELLAAEEAKDNDALPND